VRGIEQSIEQIIQQIRLNLTDRYRSAASVLREIVQNADDAGASELEFGWAPPLSAARHPLLKGCPGLWALNNAPFEALHACALHQLGLSNKPDDHVAIGRFGLGLKSVFRLCEAFFYFSSGDPSFGRQTDEDPYTPDGFLNPWSAHGRDRIHPTWAVDGDFGVVKKYLNVRLRSSAWFCLWIPLRTSATIGSATAIHEWFVQHTDRPPEELFERDIAVGMAQLLPMLRGVSVVRGWVGDLEGIGKQVFEAALTENGSRRGYPALEFGANRALQGTAVYGPSALHVTRFAGEEALIDDGAFAELRRSSEWPRSGVVIEAGKFEQRAEKGDPHCAVVFTEVPLPNGEAHRRGVLRIQPTVFLPVGEPLEQVDCPGDVDVILTLHGYFFVDAGRRRIDLPEGDFSGAANQASIRQRWNRLLLEKGVYGLVLPALARFAAGYAGCEGSWARIGQLTAAVRRTKLFEANLDAICRETQWIARLDPNGDEWRLIRSSEPYYEIPAILPEASNLHFAVFPRLRELCTTLHIVRADSPRLVSKSPSPWTESMRRQLLSSVRPQRWRMESHFEYFLRTIGSGGTATVTDEVAKWLVKISQAVFADVGLAAVRRAQAQLRALAELLPRSAMAFVGVDRASEDVGDVLMRRLWTSGMNVLLIPDESFDSVEREASEVSADDAAVALEALMALDPGGQPPGRFNDGRSAIAAQLVSKVSHAERGRFWERCRDLQVFSCRDHSQRRSDRARLLSFRELESLRSRRTLFQLLPTNLADPLQRALAEDRVVLLDSGVARRLFGDGGVPSCQERGCLDALAIGPRLDAPPQRADLLAALAASERRGTATDGSRRALRYLLHGERREMGSEEPLYVGRGDAFEQLVRLALRAHGSGWRLVSRELSPVLSGDDRNRLGVQEVDPNATVAIVRGATGCTIDCSTLTAEQRMDIIRQWPDADLDVLASLPIHETVSGRLVAIDARSYFQGDQDLEDAFGDQITLLRLTRDPQAAAKQRRLAETLTPVAALDLILRDDQPETRSRIVLDLVERVGRIPQTVRERLASVRWLVGDDGGPVAPSAVIRIEGADREVLRILQEVGKDGTRGCKAWLAIPESLRGHRAMEWIGELFAAPPDALRLLSSLLLGTERFRIGPLDVSTLDVATWVEAFRGAPGGVMPVWALVERLVSLEGGETAKEFLLSRLAGAIDGDRLTACLAQSRSRHQNASVQDRAKLVALHDQYLNAFVGHDSTRGRESLREVRLLSAGGRWRAARELVFPLDNLDLDWVLIESQATILSSILRSGSRQRPPGTVTWPSGYLNVAPEDLDATLAEDVSHVQTLCEEWDQQGADRASIAALVTLLGGHPEIEYLANMYGQPQTVEGLRERLPWTPLSAPLSGAGERAIQRIAKQRFKIAVAAGATVQVENLLGEMIEVPLRQDVTHLAVRALTFHSVGSFYVSQIWFRTLPAGAIQAGRSLEELLRETARWLLVHVYDQPDGNAVDHWWPAPGSEQLAIEVTQNLILNSLVFYLRQLGLRAEADIQPLIQDWDHAQRNRAQAQVAGTQGIPLHEALEDAERREHGVREGLRRLIEGGGRAPIEVLSAVRQKIRQFEYKAESVPFELFQNADDAYVELGQMRAGGDDGRSCRFVVRMDADALRIAHWGRAINEYRVRGSEEWTARGFERDLEKMLILQMSDKGVGEQAAGTTGKFGLGFKSTLLVTGRPLVVSGRIGFEVVGGVFPRRLHEDDDRRLRRELHRLGDQPGGTLIELPFDETAASAGVRDAVTHFRRLAPLLVVFAQAIRSCRVERPGDASVSTEWAPRPVAGLRQVAVGDVAELAGVSARSMRTLVFRTQTGALVLKVGQLGFEELPSDIPTVWVTAPTSEYLDVGFALNGAFDVDVGRMQLARASGRNLELASAMGEDIGGALCQMFDRAVEDWATLRDALGLAVDAAPQILWSSAWSLLGPRVAGAIGPAADLLRQLMWGADDRGMARLITTRSALPTGLGVGEYAALTRLDRIRWVAVGALGSDRVFAVIARWPEARLRWQPGSVIAAAQGRDLKRLLARRLAFEDLRLVDVLAAEVEDQRVSPAIADRLGEIVTPDFLEALGSEGEVGQGEAQAIRDWLADLVFQALDGTWQLAGRLLIGHEQHADFRDEVLRTAFAPSNRVASSAYTKRGVDLMRAARRMRAGAEELAAWALVADGDDRRRSVLEYLLRGELNRALAERLRPALRGTWLEGLTEDALLLRRFSLSDQAVIRGQLGLFPEPLAPLPAPPLLSAAEVLTRLYRWWRAHSQGLIEEYEGDVYPDGRVPHWGNGDPRTDVRVRREWMILFMLGMTHTMGRTTAAQHREFVRRCAHQGWLDVFAEPVDRAPERWIRVMEEYLADRVEDIEYFAWMRQFVSIFQFARWLEHYIRAFREVPRVRAPFRLADVTEPRASVLFQGTEIDAPPISRTLGTGACFVMRELSRTQRIDNEHVARYCYTPVARVRFLLRGIGWDGPTEEAQSGRDRATLSGSIYEFLVQHLGRDRALFDYAFDIPLLAITQARRRDQLTSILGRDIVLDETGMDSDEERGVW
jgi:hypothetical protein